MWNRRSGKKDDTKDDVSSRHNRDERRNGDEQRSTRHRSGSIVTSDPKKKSSSRGDDRDRGFNPTSTSYSSTSRSPYPGTASASVASSYATATGKNDDEPYIPPGLERNASLADQMPKSKSSRGQRDEDEDRDPRTERRRGDRKDDRRDSRDQDDQKRDKRDKRDKKDKDRAKDRGLSRSGNGYEEGGGTTRGPADFPDQVGSAGFSQFPGQYDGAIPGSTSAAADHPAISSRVQDQFPGQFPTQSTAPYRPPLAATEGGPGLAAEYYGDAGESVAEQPGFRKHSPSLIIGAEPHLLPASAVANPPPEPSASGGVGAAASFFSGNFESDAESSHGQQASSTYTSAPSRPDNSHHSSSAPAVPTIGGAAMGAAAGYFVGSQTSSHQQRPDHTPSAGGAPNGYSTSTYQPPPSQAQDSYYSDVSRPQKPSKPSSQGSNIPMFAAGAAGAAGLAAAAYHQSHHSPSQNGSSMPQHSTTPMAQRHRHHGPLGAVVDFFKDPDGVAQFEEYSEIIGTCRYCFAPGSSPRDAPRKHHYRKRRSNERLGSSTRIDKDSRYYSSENESRRRKDSSWLATGLAGYGLGKMGETLSKQKNDFDDAYSVKTGRHSPDGRSNKSRRRSRSNERVETGITSDGKIYKKDAHGGVFGGPSTTTYTTRRHSRSRSRDRKSSITEAALGAAVGATVAGSTSRRRSRSPQGGAWVRTRRKSREHSSEHRHKSHKKKKKEKGFFGFINGSSSSSSVDLIHPSSRDKRSSSKSSKAKPKDDHQKAEAALLGLGAAAAALALNDGRQGHKKKGVKELVGVKETKGKYARVSSASEEDEVWESAPEDDHESVNSDLAYGAPARRGSRESLSSESSGTDKWGWRWGSKKNRRDSPKRRSSDHDILPAVAGAAAAGLAGAADMSPDQYSANPMDSTSSLPLQHVYPVPTSDPSRFDVGREASVTSSSRPGVVPIQHPQPITPVSQAIYSSQAPYERSYSAPTGPPVFSQPPFQPRPAAMDARFNMPDFSIPGSLPQSGSQARDANGDFKLRRRDTSPARFGIDAAASEMTPRRRASTKDDTSAVRFDLTEEQEEQDRLERRRKRKEEKQRRETEEQEQIDRDRRASRDKSSKKSDVKTKREESPERSSGNSWAAPVAAGVVGAAIGAVVAEGSKSDETREERRERRRREREREEAEEEEETNRRRERRRRDRERDGDKSTSKDSRKLPDEVKEVREDTDQQAKPTKKEVWKSTSTHEDYGSFFTLPPELVDKSTDQVKVTTANADADVDLNRSPRIVTVGPKGSRDRSASPVFSPADTDETMNPSMSFPWRVPRLRLLEPTPPSSRGSTPVIRPKDASDEDIEEPIEAPIEAPIEEPPRKPSTSRVTWGDDQTHEYTVITPHYEREEFIESPPGESSDRYQADSSKSREERESSLDRKKPIYGATSSNAPRTFDDDIEFAATLAASAEDAGFDPSIVTDDPKYRRRDSPPGSNERSLPGGFEDEDESRASRKERKRRDKANGRDDNAVVQDIISQVEESKPQTSKQHAADDVDDRENTRKSKSKKSKKSRKDSESKDEFFETSESADKPRDPYSREVYESPPEDVQSTVSSVPGSNDGENGKKSRRRSKRDSTDFDDAASIVSSRSRDKNTNDSGSQAKDKPKGSLWSRVLGKPADSPPQKNGTKDVRSEATAEDLDEPKRKSKRSKERRSTRDEADDYDAARKSSGSRERSRKRRSSEGSTTQDSGRITQDLPAKVYTPAPSGRALSEQMLINPKDQESSRSTKVPEAGSVAQFLINDSDAEQVDEQQSEPFLGQRPEPPPPPDIYDEEKEPPDPAATALPASAPSRPSDHIQQYATSHAPEPLQSPTALPSPTAVPIHFRRPRPIDSPRSLSQTPLSSTEVAADITPRQKPRPRSTEFRGSKDMRPLWLVERHNSHQEPAPEVTYPALPPSLPSSHTTSRASSVHDPEERDPVQTGDFDLNAESHDPLEEGRGLTIDTDKKAMDSDLLDSQQATPTASSFQHATASQGMPSPPTSRPSSPKPAIEETTQTSSTLRDAALVAALGGSAAFALHRASQHDEPSRQELSRDEDEQFQQGLDDMALDSGAHRQHESSTQVFSRKEDDQFQPGFEDTAPGADVDRPSDDQLAYEDDFAPQKTKKGKKGKKGKRKASKAEEKEVQSSISDTAPAKSSQTTEPQPLSPEDVRQIQEQDAQNAVDSWFAPAPSKKDKKKKKEGVLDGLPEASELAQTTDLPREDGEPAEPASVQQNEDLTREMSRDQVVDTMTAASQDVDQDEGETTQPTTIAEQAPLENLLEIRQSKSKGKKGKKGRKSLVLDDNLPSSAKEIGFVDPFTEQSSEDTSQTSQLRDVSENTPETATDKLPTVTLPDLFISPEATPLPEEDDFDLQDELPPSPVVQPTDEATNQELDAESKEPLKETRTRGEYPFPEQPLEEPSILPTQLEQNEADDFFTFPSKKKGKKGKKTASAVVNKEADVQEESQLPTVVSEVDENRAELPSLVDEPVVDAPQEESQAAEDEWAGFGGKKKGKKGKKTKQSSMADTNLDGEVEEQTPLPAATPKELEDEQVQYPVNEPVIDVPQEESRTVEDEWAGSSGKRKGKKGKKQKSKALDLEPESQEPEQTEPQPSIRDFTKEPAPTATTTTSQDVTTMLENENAKATTDPDTNEPSLPSAEADRELQEPVQNSSPSADLDLREGKADTTAKHFEIQDFEIQESKLQDPRGDVHLGEGNDAPPTLESSAAAVDTARGVQDILRGENLDPSTTDRQDDAEITPPAVEEPSTDKSLEVEESDWDAPKKKKGKKSKKNEIFPLDEPETTESGQSFTLPAELEPPLDPEPTSEAIDQPSSKKSKKDKKSKRKSLSRTVSDYQDTEEPEVATGEEPKDTAANAKLSDTPFPPRSADTAAREPLEVTGSTDSTLPGDSNEVSGVALTQEQDSAPPKNKKDKKSKKPIALAWEDEAAPTREEEPVSESKDLGEDVPAQAMPLEDDILQTPEQMAEDRPKSKKDRKKAKKSQAFSWEDDAAFAREDEPPSESRSLGEDALEHTKPLDDAVLGNPEEIAEDRPKSKKDKKKAKKSQAFSWEVEDTPAQSEREIAEEHDQKIEELPQRQAEVDTPINIEESLTAEQEGKAPVQDLVEPVSRDDPSDASRAGHSSAPSLAEQASSAPDDVEVRQLDDSIASVGPTVDTEVHPTYSLKKSKNDKKKGKKARSSTWDVEIQPEPKEISEKPAAREDPDAPSIVPMSQDSKDWSRLEQLTEEIEPTEVVEPDDKELESRSYEESTTEGKPSGDTGVLRTLHEAEPEDEFAPVKKGKKGKRSKKGKQPPSELEDDQPFVEPMEPPPKSAPGLTQDEGLLPEERPLNDLMVSEDAQTTQEASIPTGPTLELETASTVPEIAEVSNTRDEDELWDMPVKKGKKCKKQRKEAQKAQEESSSTAPAIARDLMEVSPNTLAAADVETSHPSTAALPTSTAEAEIQDLQEQRHHAKGHAEEFERHDVKRPQSAERDVPSPVAEVEMMYTQDQDEYDKQHPIEREREDVEGAQDPARDLPCLVTEVEMMYAQDEREHDNGHVHEQEMERSRSPGRNLPTPAAEVDMLAPQEQQQYDETYSEERERQGAERLPSPSPSVTSDLPTPAREVEMLNPQEQREYNEEYAKELERQLSPPEEGESPYTPPAEVRAPAIPQPSIGAAMQPPYEDVHRPLAKPPSLEDIIEESRSRPDSVQESSAPPDREDDFSPFKSTKKSKKGKKGKKQQQPVIWEDETATPPVDEENEEVVDPSVRSMAIPGSWETEEPHYPIALEEPLEHLPVEEGDYVSPTRDLSAYRDSLREYGEAGDYFSIQPSRGAEEDVIMEQPDKYQRAMSTELPRHTRNESIEQGPLSEQDGHRHADEYRRHEADEMPEREFRELQDQSMTESTSAEERAHGDPGFAPSKKSKKGKMSKRSLGLLPGDVEREPSPSNLQSEELVDESTHPDFSPRDSSRGSREPSLQRSSHFEVEPVPIDKEQSTSEGRSRSSEGLAAAAGLGIGALAAEGLSRRDSKKEKKRSKKNKKSSKWEEFEEETPESGSPVDREEYLAEDQERRPASEHFSNREQQQSLVTPPQSPSLPTSYEPATAETRDMLQPLESSNVRDSAIHVSDSPVVSEEPPVHRVLRDSGYPETEPSPIVDVEPQYQNTPTARELDEPYGREPEHTIEGYDHEYRKQERRGSMPKDSIDVTVEADPDYDVSISRPNDRRRRSRRRRSGAAYDSDDSNDSGFDIQRRRRRMQAMKDEGREPSPVSSTTKERSSELFGSSPSARQEHADQPHEQHTPSRSEHLYEEPTWSFGPEASPQARSRDASGKTESTHASDQVTDFSTYEKLTGGREEPPPSLFGGPVIHDEDTMSRSMSPPSSDARGRRRLNTISEETSPLHKKDKRATSDIGSPETGVKERRMRSPVADDDEESYLSTEDPISRTRLPKHEHKDFVDIERSLSRDTDQSSRQSNVSNVPHKHHDGEGRKSSIASMQSDNSIHAIIRTPDQARSASGQSFRSSGTPPLRRVDRSVSGDLRGASKKSEAKSRAKSSQEDPELDTNIPSSSTYDPVTDKGKSRTDMADVYVSLCIHCFNNARMQEANLLKQEGWGDVRGGSPMSPTRPPSMRKRQSMQLLEYETRLDQLVSENRLLQNQKTTAERSLEDQARDHSQQRHAYEEAMQEHKMFLAQKGSELSELKGTLREWQSKVTHLTEVNEGLTSLRGLDDDHEERYRTLKAEHTNLREQHTQLSTGMEDIVRHEVSVALEEKNVELRQLRDELEHAKQQVRDLQQQLLASRSSEDFVERDEDYFDSQCQSLCQHVQQWVLRFSKFSDMKACYHPSEIRDENRVDRVENAILDGTDVDEYLQDRVKRRDVFMSVVMTMIWEFVFTRYLFGMDREQRQKLKNLEKTLQEVGPISAVHKWRATTLTLLMKREAFESQRATDTEAVVHEIYDTLATFLPPPSHLVNQIQESLRKVISAAVDLSIEMRTQRSEYSMLPPLQPEYNTNGDLARKVYFSALTMNERSGQTSSNEALQEQRAVVRMVLFPLVVKNEDDDEQIVVCPAQVLTAEGSKGKGKSVRVMSAQGGRSEASFAGTDVNMEGGMI